ncbi:MAG: hypothetical protein DRK00_05690 [Thermoprotei archaeon]|nr:MAG: hypothetical protein DRK00_05690 [Thermoprotei archaeon]
MKSRYEQLSQILEELRRDNPGLDACAVVSGDGMPVAAVMPEGVDDLKISAMAATLQGVAEQVVRELRGGGLKQLVAFGEREILIIRSVNQDFALVMVVRPDSKLGYALWQARRASESLGKLLTP